MSQKNAIGNAIVARANQFAVLFRKNAILARRNWKGTVGQLISPLAIVLMLLGFQYLSNYILSRDEEFPRANVVGSVPRCVSRNGLECKTILYMPQGVPWVDELMKNVAEQNNLDFNTDFMSMGHPSNGLKTDNATLINYIVNNQNKTQNALFFTAAYAWTGSNIPKDTGYILLYNYTYESTHRHYSPAIQLMRSVDQAILQMRTNNSDATIEIETMDFPQAPNRMSSYDVVAANGGVWFYVPPMVTFFILLTEIVMEKESRLRLGMQMMGLKSGIYWISWFADGAIFVCLSTLILMAAGYACNFEVFTNSNFFAVFLMFFLHGLAIECMAFFVSTMVSRSKTAQTLGYGFILIGFVFQCILCSGYGILVDLLYQDDIAHWVIFIRWVFTMYPSFNFAKMFSDVANRSSNTINIAAGEIIKGPGFTWSDLYQQRTVQGFFSFPEIVVPAPVNSFYYLLMNAGIFIVLTWYLDKVLVTGEHGSSKPWYFPFTLEYWGCGSKKKTTINAELSVSEDSKDYDEDVAYEEQQTIKSPSDVPVRVVQLCKSFQKYPWKSDKDLKAVNGISFSVQKGEIFCLLGPNGAGKTTTINMLTGVLSPDDISGGATVMGYDIHSEMDDIRKRMGVTPQHDILWPELTALEHLQLFAKLKGLPSSVAILDIDKKLTQMGLFDVRNQLVGSFSGGMKRRLSVAIAALGDPDVLYMDEPSTGMDPVNRRALWDLIQELKQDRAIILTTHSLEEADLLGDKIAIMVYGKMRCVGNALHLKNKFGSGYHVSVVMNNNSNTGYITQKTKEFIPDAVLAYDDAGSLNFKIPQTTNNVESMPKLLQFLEEASSESVVREWGVSHTTLEEVFLEVTKKHGFAYEDPEVEDYKDEDEDDEKHSLIRKTKKGVTSYPFRALIRKNLSLQARQKGTNCCQIVTPILVMAILLILQLIIRNELHGQVDTMQLVPTFPWPLNQNPLIPAPNPPGEEFFDRDVSDVVKPAPRNYGHCLTFFLFTDSTTTPAGAANPSGLGNSGLLSKIMQHGCDLHNDTRVHVPYFLNRSSIHDIDQEIFTDLESLNKVAVQKLQYPPYSYLLPDGAVNFQEVNYSSIRLKYAFSVNDAMNARYHRKNNFTRIDLADYHFAPQFALLILPGRLAMMNLIDEAFTHWVLNENPDTDPLHYWLNMKWAQPMPTYAEANILAALEILGTLLYPIALTLQLPIYIYILVMEKSEKLIELMKSHGMKARHYIVTNFMFNFTLYAIVVGFFWIVGAIIKIRFFAQTAPSTLFLFFLGWGLSLVSLSFLLSTFLNSKRAATVLGYVVALFGSLIGLVICVGIYGQFNLSLSPQMPMAFLLWPQFAFVRGIFLMNYACAANYACYGPVGQIPITDEVSHVLIFLYVDAVIIFVLALYLDAVLPKEYGVPRHPLFFLKPIYELFTKPPKTEKHHSFDGITDHSPLVPRSERSSTSNQSNEDSDVVQETALVHSEEYLKQIEKHPLVIHDLVKRFGPNKVAVDKLNLCISEGECFGLLGENGAGKTTTISICTGLIQPTTGYALVGGYDIRTDINKVHLVIGVCPQFSILWETLTVEEHLLFYARLKGISASHEKEHVQKSLKKFGLVDAASRMASKLSGGMQRRLSIAIALIGHSEIVFLDEPTTGLDPASRHQIWKLINNAKVGRAIVLTTHSMEEAELLSSRIGIMVTGKLRCLGSPLHLKNKFADGYCLNINFEAHNKDFASKAIQTLLPEAKEVSSFKTTKEYRIRLEHGKVSHVFALMEANAAKSKITDWSITQVGLEDVFQKIVKDTKNTLTTLVINP